MYLYRVDCVSTIKREEINTAGKRQFEAIHRCQGDETAFLDLCLWMERHLQKIEAACCAPSLYVFKVHVSTKPFERHLPSWDILCMTIPAEFRAIHYLRDVVTK